MADEESPLLTAEKKDDGSKPQTVPFIHFCAFIISLSVAFTWVPMIYVFRLMTCDQYYKDHLPFSGPGDHCSIPEIEGSTATAVSLLGTTTTIFGVINLIWAGWLIKKFGVKAALIQQTIWPAVRLCCQVVAVTIGAKEGMMIIQITQFICALGGPAGYLLTLNTYASKCAEETKRTAVFGQLQGAVMFGTAFGYLLGGVSGDWFGIRRPFEVAFFLMIVATLYSLVFLPYISPSKIEKTEKGQKKSLASIFGPAKLFVPTKIRLENRRVTTYCGVFLLGAGVFWGVLATGFIPILIQMYATDAFGFGPMENGYLMSFNSLIRGAFLTFGFPKIILSGRRWYATTAATSDAANTQIPTSAEAFESMLGLESEQEPPRVPTPVSTQQGSAFDLFFLKWSLVVDCVLTGSATFSRQGWHIYLAAFLLPLASGSAPAAKGVMMEMCDQSQRDDALSAITLIEMIATLSTMSVFGLVFSHLAEMGKSHLVFVVNASIAVLAVAILAFSSFPPSGSVKVADPPKPGLEEESLLVDVEDA
ncbi:hypothetical protein LSUE1_G003144 [Lachnellula suecica]|uniref:Uncharacterized protein n=1 Tax=Lachnellula suecica TaxID=602035 RepID=A0A8T9CB18_9HELO|nr:hypothetical protein LSUE1_G003144 [Lachnellula suecica]